MLIEPLTTLAVLGLVVWLILRRRSPGAPGDQAAALRRVFVYGLLLAGLVMTVQGTIDVLETAIGDSAPEGDESDILARGMALLIVGGPTFGLLLRHVTGALRGSPAEQTSSAWTLYLDAALFISLLYTMVGAFEALDDLIGPDDFEVVSMVAPLVWGAAWALHWFRLLRAFGASSDLHLATGSATGLVALGIGSGGLLGELLRRGYVELTDLSGAEPALREWAIVAALGAVVWAWYWWREYRSAPRSDAWYVHVLLVGALGGMGATIVASATGLYDVLVWAIGDRSGVPADEHFEWVPVSAGVLAVGAASWAYHRWVIGRDEPDVRTGPMRVYDYLVAAAGLVASAVALSVGIVAVIEGVTPEPRGVDVSVTNRLLLAATIGIVGAPTWAVAWNRIRGHRARDSRGELYSDVRRVYLIGLFGVGGLVVLGSAVAVLVIGLQDLLDSEFGGETVRAMRVGLALIASVTGIAWYHLLVFRNDRAASQDLVPAPEVVRHRVIVVASAGSPTPAGIARNTTAEITAWTRLDSLVEADVDPEQLANEVDACPSPDVLVIGTTAGWSVIPINELNSSFGQRARRDSNPQPSDP
jgi:hypothetical protein